MIKNGMQPDETKTMGLLFDLILTACDIVPFPQYKNDIKSESWCYCVNSI